MAKTFRNTFTQRAGTDPAKILYGKIIGINLVNWTVDFRGLFDRHDYFNVQVGTPYAHYNRGEGIYVFPEVGAACTLLIPGDSSPPYISSFLMPFENVDAATPDAPTGLESHGSTPQNATTASFAGGRSRPKPGDIYLKTRDQNFVVLHRGGVLQIGSTELCQRIYLPLQNHIVDISQTYSHQNAGGSILWGIQQRSTTDLPTQFVQNFRVFADDQYADIRISQGKVHAPIGEPPGDDGELQNLIDLNIGQAADNDKEGPIVWEVVISPKGFNAESGDAVDPVKTRNNTTLRYFFDRKGGAFLRCMGNVLLSFKSKSMIHARDDMTLKGDKNIFIKAKGGVEISGGDYCKIQGDLIRLGEGTMPIARQGDMTRTLLPAAQVSGTLSGAPFTGVLTIVTPLYGTIISGNSRLLG